MLPDLPTTALPETPATTPLPVPPIVAVGASAGGLQAFITLLDHIPPDSGLAYVFIQHLDPHQPSLLAELLASHTAMPVHAATDQLRVEPNQVYLIPPNAAMTITQGLLALELPSEVPGQRSPIDQFFRSLALDRGAAAIGIVLSGNGTDGTDGLAAILERGGLTIAQAPNSAAYPSMPQYAINRGVVVRVAEIAAMPDLIVQRLRQQPNGNQPSEPPDEVMIDAIITLLHQMTGHNFSQYKQTTLRRRIDRRMLLLHLSSVADYYAQLQQDRTEVERLFQDLLISVTAFFRDPASFEALSTGVLRQLVQKRDPNLPLRVWVPGCATGEEAYSLAILLQEQLSALSVQPMVQIFATDIDETALSIARQGRYDMSIAGQISAERLARFFVADQRGYQVAKIIRERCLFSAHNLISDPPFGNLDLISCRNLLIYFDTELQQQLIPVFHYALAPSGFLFLGSAESATNGVDELELFRIIDRPNRIYQRRDRLLRPQTDLPWIAQRPPAQRLDNTTRLPLSGMLDLGAALERTVLRDYAPTATVIDEKGTIAYLIGRTYPYLSVPTGMPTTNLIALAHPEIQFPLRAAIRAVASGQQIALREDLTISTAEGKQRLNLVVKPFNEPDAESGLLLVIIQTIGLPVPSAQLAAPREHDEPLTALAQELAQTRETLEVTIRELQASNRDLVMANEELRSLNEELQVTNEEFQTSKEEIQSINEELQTVNAELSHKIDALDRANADLANLFASIQIPAIFLHADGKIARFTPQAIEFFALIPSDIGRPIADITARFAHRELQQVIAQALEQAQFVETLLTDEAKGRWWRVQLRPFGPLIDIVDGIVLTFTDITLLKRAEAVLLDSHAELEQRVVERTHDLAVANDALQAQITKRIEIEQARQSLFQQLMTSQEEERRHVARELHDQFGRDLTALIFGLKALEDDEQLDRDRLSELQKITLSMSREMRDLAVRLRPLALDDLGLTTALTNYVENWSVQARVAVDFHISQLETLKLPLALETALYRLVQEALTNVMNHAQASEVSVIIEASREEVRLIVEDDGIGFEPLLPTQGDELPRLGLIGMKERVTLLEGTLTIESALGSGTTIFARIPLRSS